MKKLFFAVGVFLIGVHSANAQLLKRLQEKAAGAAERVVDRKIEEKADQLLGGAKQSPSGDSGTGSGSNSGLNTATGGNNSSGRQGRMGNTQGGGLVTTPPDVNANLSSAETAFKSQNYGSARYALQQAMMGVEMEIGQKLLSTLPEQVAGVPKETEEDKVTSSGWGWAGLTIHRSYRNDSRQFLFTITNSSLLSSVNHFLVNGGYMQSSDQKWKQIMVKGNRAMIEYDESSGYKVSVPLGQSSLILFEGINFASEQDMLNAVNEFDIDRVKATLGEK